MDKIAEAEATLADYRAHYMDVGAPELAEVLSPLIALAKDQREELARLKAPLGDEGRVAVAWLRKNLPPCSCWNMAAKNLEFHTWDCNARRASEAADLIERQAAALAEITKGVEALTIGTGGHYTEGFRMGHDLAIDAVRAILDQHVPAQEVVQQVVELLTKRTPPSELLTITAAGVAAGLTDGILINPNGPEAAALLIRLSTVTEEDVERVARAICAADTKAPTPDAPIIIGMKTAKAWEARVPMARAALTAFLT